MRRAVGDARRLVELVRELVQRDVAPVLLVVGTLDDVRPGQHDLALDPGFTGEELALLLQHAAGPGVQAIDEERARVDQDLPQPWIAVAAAARATAGRRGWRS